MIKNFVCLSFYCFSIKPIVPTMLAFSRDFITERIITLENHYCMSTMQLLQLKVNKQKLIHILFIPIKQYKSYWKFSANKLLNT